MVCMSLDVECGLWAKTKSSNIRNWKRARLCCVVHVEKKIDDGRRKVRFSHGSSEPGHRMAGTEQAAKEAAGAEDGGRGTGFKGRQVCRC